MILKNFVVFEGCDGAGTTTQRRILSEKLADFSKKIKKISVFNTAEPTNNRIGILIREILKNSLNVSPETLAFLFAADRNEHLFGKDGIVEHCEQQEITICDRYVLSSLVYQGIECGDELPLSLNKYFPLPELLLFLDVDAETAGRRIAVRGGKTDIYEYTGFQVKARERYNALLPQCAAQGSVVEMIDGAAPVDEVAVKVWSAVQKLPILQGEA